MHSQTLIVFLVLAACVSTGYGIKCYVCNSQDHGECNDPFQPEVAKDLLIDCSQMNDTRGQGKRNEYTFCRKTLQKTALVGMKPEEKRVIRTCGFLNDSRLAPEDGDDRNALKCYRRVGTFEVELLYCGCHEDGCNPASRPGITIGVILTTLFSCVFMRI